MAKNLILKSQANEIFEAIRKRGLEPSEFKWKECESTEDPSMRVSMLVHEPTRFYFIFDYLDGKHSAVCSPGLDASQAEYYPDSWEGQCQYARFWLGCLKREIEAPNLWGALRQETKLAEAASASGAVNTPFTADEQKDISARMQGIEKYLIATQKLSKENEEFVRRRLDYLVAAAGRQGRQDWIHTTIGVLFTIVTGVALAPDAARELFRFVTGHLRVLCGTLLLP